MLVRGAVGLLSVASAGMPAGLGAVPTLSLSPTQFVPPREPFVVLRGGKTVRFSSLASAVRAARSGEVIEVLGNGPYATEAINLGGKALTIRAARGALPVIGPAPAPAGAVRSYEPVLYTEALLVLEGLTFEAGAVTGAWSPHCFVRSERSVLRIANCRFQFLQGMTSAVVVGLGRGEVRNCDFDCPWSSVAWFLPAEGELTFVNCVFRAEVVLFLDSAFWRGGKPRLRLQRCTCRGTSALVLTSVGTWKAPAKPRIHVEADRNVFAPAEAVLRVGLGLPLETMPKVVPALMSWKGEGNVCSDKSDLLRLIGLDKGKPAIQRLAAAAEWGRLWGNEKVDLRRGPVRFLTPRDYRLHPDSTGALEEATGALVGPWPAYEAWQKTSEYQAWQRGHSGGRK
jgi:hypothetical protein